MSLISRLAVVGAGSVGSSLAYAALIRGSASEVILYDIAEEKTEAEVLDLAHGTQFTGTSRVSGGSDISCVEGASIVVITAGAKQKPGQTRLELAGTNVGILEVLMPQLLHHAPDAIYILVSNPVDVLTVAAAQISGLPHGRLFGSGCVLDSARLRWLIGAKSGVAQQSVHAMMLGEHGDTEFPLWSQARIGTVPLREWTDRDGERLFSGDVRAAIHDDVAHAAYKIIAGKGATNYAIGLSGARIVEAVLRDEHAVMPVSSTLRDYRGISGIALSVPCVVGAHGIERVLDTPMDEHEAGWLDQSASTLHDTLKSLGLE
ncbi:MAG TPA: L-lactate dehydrogenase [Microlunatus sp.]|nr:L-lactate dehydrogenase [Microlunatus sp.]